MAFFSGNFIDGSAIETIANRKRYSRLILGFPKFDEQGNLIDSDNAFDLADLKYTAVIEKDISKEPNKADITIYNLSPDTRGKIEAQKSEDNSKAGIPVLLEAGYILYGRTDGARYDDLSYGYDLDIIFNGSLRGILNYSEPPEWITRLTSGDGEKAIQTSQLAITEKGPVKARDVLKTLLVRFNEDLLDRGPNNGLPVDLDSFDSFQEVFDVLNINPSLIASNKKQLAVKKAEEQTRNYEKSFGKIKFETGNDNLPFGISFSGNTYKSLYILCKSLGIELSIQNSKVQLLKRNNPLGESAIKLGFLNAQQGNDVVSFSRQRLIEGFGLNTGLIGTPQVDDKGNVKFEHLMIPGLRPGRIIQLISAVTNGSEGFFRITKLRYTIDSHSNDNFKVSVEAQPLKAQRS